MKHALSLTGLILASVVVSLAGIGCTDAGHRLTEIRGWPEFQHRVLKADRPVLIEFNKDPCPTCVIQQAELDKLAAEFGESVFFAKMTIMVGDFQVTVPEVRDGYNIFWVPTTVLFVDGKEVQRWPLNHTAWQIRPAVAKAVAEYRQRPRPSPMNSRPALPPPVAP